MEQSTGRCGLRRLLYATHIVNSRGGRKDGTRFSEFRNTGTNQQGALHSRIDDWKSCSDWLLCQLLSSLPGATHRMMMRRCRLQCRIMKFSMPVTLDPPAGPATCMRMVARAYPLRILFRKRNIYCGGDGECQRLLARRTNEPSQIRES